MISQLSLVVHCDGNKPQMADVCMYCFQAKQNDIVHSYSNQVMQMPWIAQKSPQTCFH